MAYHPSIGEEVSIERLRDRDCFRACITSVAGEPGDPPWDVKIEFERLDGVSDRNPTCNLSEVSWTYDPAKETDFREFQTKLVLVEDQVERAEDEEQLKNF